MEKKFSRTMSIKNWDFYLDEGKRDFNTRYNSQPTGKEYRRTDFTIIRTIGEGAFSRVYLATMQVNKANKYYAMKIMDKMKIYKLGETKHVINEKNILGSINFPFCIYLETSFKDNSYVYLCLPFIPGGEMFKHLRRKKKFDETLSKFYGAQVFLALEYLHHCDVIYRDMKPENLLIDVDGYLKLADFGFSKRITDRTYTICGTPDYLAPELLVHKGYGKSVDWWAYGVLLYEMTAGSAPFKAKHLMKTCQNILCCRYTMPNLFSLELKHLIQNLLQPDATKRFGCKKEGIRDIKEHPWFNDISWLDIYHRQVKAPYIPAVKDAGDASNFNLYKEVRIEVSTKDYFKKEFEDF